MTHLELDEDVFVNESEAKDILFHPDQVQILVIRMKKRRRYRYADPGAL